MDLHKRLLQRAHRDVLGASLIALFLGAASLLVALRTWSDRGYVDFQIIFGIIDAIVVLALGLLLYRRITGAAALLILLGALGIAWGLREGVPLIAAVPNLIAIAFYARAWSSLRYLRPPTVDEPLAE